MQSEFAVLQIRSQSLAAAFDIKGRSALGQGIFTRFDGDAVGQRGYARGYSRFGGTGHTGTYTHDAEHDVGKQ